MAIKKQLKKQTNQPKAVSHTNSRSTASTQSTLMHLNKNNFYLASVDAESL